VQAIVTEIDDPHREAIENVWGELKAVFGLRGVVGATRPHFVYQLAETYAAARVDGALSRIAAETAPFSVETAGLGLFRGRRTVLALVVHREGEVARLHERIWREAAVAATGPRSEYAAATWAPHVTLAVGDFGGPAQLDAIARFLERRDYHWSLPVTNLCVVEEARSATQPWRRFDLVR